MDEDTKYLKEERENNFTLMIVLSYTIIAGALFAGYFYSVNLYGVAVCILTVWAGYYSKKLSFAQKLTALFKGQSKKS